MTNILGWLLGLDNVDSIDDIEPSLAAPWAQQSPVWVVLGCALLVALAVFFYLKFQPRGAKKWRIGLGICRGLLLALLLITLADPILRIGITEHPRPLVYLLVDGTDSMGIRDEMQKDGRDLLDAAVGRDAKGDTSNTPPSRADYVRALLAKPQGGLIERLVKEKDYRVETFVFDGTTTSQVRKLTFKKGADGQIDVADIPKQITSSGQVTSLGAALEDLNQQHGSSRLRAVLMLSDFADNSSVPLLGDRGAEAAQAASPVKQLGVPIFTLGFGNTKASNISIDVQPPLRMQRAERTAIRVKLAYEGADLDGKTVEVMLKARSVKDGREEQVGKQEVKLDYGRDANGKPIESNTKYLEIPYTPKVSGHYEFVGTVMYLPPDGVPQAKLPGEAVVEDNTKVSDEINIIDDYMRLMYVAFEPSWEWRFIKEVFHRDKLVGMRGFRTFLLSSDEKVRKNNPLFLPSLLQKRSDFFAHDVIFLGDMPEKWLSPQFCKMTKEFVSEFGGGLVVIVGPRFGGTELAKSDLRDMLPVVLEPSVGIKEYEDPDGGFELLRTPEGREIDFMQLGDAKTQRENEFAWKNLGKLRWYQPVKRLHPLGTALAVHPQHSYEVEEDGKKVRKPMPIIAMRRYGKGEVVYVGIDELWRLRREHGETYYRQFWSQLINRMALSHALGSQKRFVVRTDRQEYKADEKVTVTVDAYDKDFSPLDIEKFPTLTGQLIRPTDQPGETHSEKIVLTSVGGTRYEARLPVFSGGDYVVRVEDPVTKKEEGVRFRAKSDSAERRVAARNEKVQASIAADTGGNAYELTQVGAMVDAMHLEPTKESYLRNHALWTTPLWFIVVISLMLGEWISRKMMNLS